MLGHLENMIVMTFCCRDDPCFCSRPKPFSVFIKCYLYLADDMMVGTKPVEPPEPRLSQHLQLDELWDALSICLTSLAKMPDSHAVLVLQPTVEAFFLVHAGMRLSHLMSSCIGHVMCMVNSNHLLSHITVVFLP